jgi:hypothetical protein
MNNCSSKTACISPACSFIFLNFNLLVIARAYYLRPKESVHKLSFNCCPEYPFIPISQASCVFIYYDVSRNVTATPKMSNVVNFSKYQSRDTATFCPGPAYIIFKFFLSESL